MYLTRGYRSACMLLTACAFLCVAGCGGVGMSGNSASGPSVQVVYQGKPLQDIQICLHASRGGPVLTRAVSRLDGKAYFSDLPLPEPDAYFVTIESVADGGWILDPKACKELTESISLQPLEGTSKQELLIPNGAVKVLSSSRRR